MDTAFSVMLIIGYRNRRHKNDNALNPKDENEPHDLAGYNESVQGSV